MDLILAHREQLIETGISLIAFLLVRRSGRHIVRNAVIRSSFKAKEEKEVLRLLDLFATVVFTIVVTAIWGVKQNEILIFATSVITVLGVALFAEMSILSNVTACLVLFFQHPVRIGDLLRVEDGDVIHEGTLVDITYFFVFLRTADDRIVTIPNATLLKVPFTIVQHERRT